MGHRFPTSAAKAIAKVHNVGRIATTELRSSAAMAANRTGGLMLWVLPPPCTHAHKTAVAFV
jgi:hypothetical protein